MSESKLHYTQDQLARRRKAEQKMIVRRGIGTLAVMAAIAIPVNAAGGARSFARDVGQFAGNRIAMIRDAFGSDPSRIHPGPHVRRLEHDIAAQKAEDHASAIQAEASQLAAASTESGDSAVTEMPQGK